MVDEVLIRAARPADSDAVTVLLSASYSELLAPYYDGARLARTLPYMTKANPALLASGTYYVAEADLDHPVGCGGWTVEVPGTLDISEGVGHIRHFATHPRWTRRGVGTALLTRCFNDTQQFGLHRLYCYSSLNAEGFYRACGFERIRPIEVPMGPGLTFPSVLMRRELA